MTKTEKLNLLFQVRKKLFARMSQEEMARALQVSLPTIARWEGGSVEVPDETAQMLQCLVSFVEEERRQKNLKAEEIKQALLQTGLVGVLSSAAIARRLPKAVLAGLTLIPMFGWIGLTVGAATGFAVSPYFRKLFEGEKKPKGET